jgi:hypothetical protein
MPVTSQLTANPFVKVPRTSRGVRQTRNRKCGRATGSDGIVAMCRHGFSFIARDDGGNDYDIGDEEVDFIVTIAKTPTYKACKAYKKCVSGETKEKHCYVNDKRWRGFHNGWW